MAVKVFYTYVWLRQDGTPYYIGKGTRNRAYRKGSPTKDRIVVFPASSETEAFETEIALIWYYGRKDLGTGLLINRTEGGDGVSGWERSDSWRENQSRLMAGRKHSEDERLKISEGQIGNKRSKETRELQSKLAKKRGTAHMNTPEARANKSAKLKGRVFTEAWKEKLRVAAIARARRSQ